MRTQPSAEDPKFMAVIWPILKRTPAYLRLGWALAREPAIPQRNKLLLYAMIAYQVSPVHYIVTPIPVIGQIDFFVLLALSIKQMLDHCPPAIARGHFQKLGLAEDQLDRDWQTMRTYCGKSVAKATRQMSSNARFAGRVAGGVGRRMLRRLALRILMADS